MGVDRIGRLDAGFSLILTGVEGLEQLTLWMFLPQPRNHEIHPAVLVVRGGTAADNDVRDILIDLAQRDTMNSSALLARELITTLDRSIYMRSKDIKFAGFRVLKAPDIPSVLVEMGYISNLNEEKKLRTSAHQEQIANRIAEGIENFIKAQR